MAEELLITIHPEGKVELRVRGRRGRSCLDLTEEIETRLGEVQGREMCPEYHEIPLRGETHALIRCLRNHRD